MKIVLRCICRFVDAVLSATMLCSRGVWSHFHVIFGNIDLYSFLALKGNLVLGL
jgi:hypothetical protein